jgi:hypothetical protein
MGVPVTIDSDDLRKVVFAAGGVKLVEQALAGWNEDPLRQETSELTGAVNRAAAELRRVQRAADKYPKPEAFEPPTSRELNALRELNSRLGGLGWGFANGDVTWLVKDTATLRLKGLLELGNLIVHCQWADTQVIERKEVANLVGIFWRLTPKGLAALEAKGGDDGAAA